MMALMLVKWPTNQHLKPFVAIVAVIVIVAVVA